jgi:predicted HicB family RNase H-like nuclease
MRNTESRPAAAGLDDRGWMELERAVRNLTGHSIDDLTAANWELLESSFSPADLEAVKEYGRQLALAVSSSRSSLVTESRPKNKDEQLWIRIESSVKRRLEDMAADEDVKLAEFVRRMLNDVVSRSSPLPDGGGKGEVK